MKLLFLIGKKTCCITSANKQIPESLYYITIITVTTFFFCGCIIIHSSLTGSIAFLKATKKTRVSFTISTSVNRNWINGRTECNHGWRWRIIIDIILESTATNVLEQSFWCLRGHFWQPKCYCSLWSQEARYSIPEVTGGEVGIVGILWLVSSTFCKTVLMLLLLNQSALNEMHASVCSWTCQLHVNSMCLDFQTRGKKKKKKGFFTIRFQRTKTVLSLSLCVSFVVHLQRYKMHYCIKTIKKSNLTSCI